MKYQFMIQIHGKLTHGSAPHLGHDAIVAAAAVVQALQIFASRMNNPNDTFVLTVGKLEGGTKENIITDLVALEGMAEGTQECFMAELPEKMAAMVKAVAMAYDCTGECVCRRVG